MLFEKVLSLLRTGIAFRRESWENPKERIIMGKVTDINGDTLPGVSETEMQFIVRYDEKQEGSYWEPKLEDILAEDWVAVARDE